MRNPLNAHLVNRRALNANILTPVARERCNSTLDVFATEMKYVPKHNTGNRKLKSDPHKFSQNFGMYESHLIFWECIQKGCHKVTMSSTGMSRY